MNSLEKLSCLATIPQHSVSVFTADWIPRVWTKPTACVCNTDNHFKPGNHWVAAYADTLENGWYFDSFGVWPIIPDHISRLRKSFKRLRWNTTHLQSLSSDVCGQYCMIFLYYMSKGLGISKDSVLIKYFSKVSLSHSQCERNKIFLLNCPRDNQYVNSSSDVKLHSYILNSFKLLAKIILNNL